VSLDLDDRQRSMLEEMRIRLWSPRVAPEFIANKACPERSTRQFSTEEVVLQPLRPLPGGISDMGWQELRQAIATCTACALCSGRRNTVFGAGDEQADWLIVGEVPDRNADLQGEPFVGPAGKLLDNMLRAVGASRESKAFVANALKCRAPGDRNVTAAEAAQCEPYLRRQVALIRPRVIVAMGRLAVRSLLGSDEPIGKLRGRVHEYHGVPVVFTLPLDHLLHSRAEKARVWADLCLARAAFGTAQCGR
jgi:uracil-DNA glycosylase